MFNLPTGYGSLIPQTTTKFEEFIEFCPNFDDLINEEY